MLEKDIPIIDVTPEMQEAGVTELREHLLGGNLRELAQNVYRAMEYERLEQLCPKSDKK